VDELREKNKRNRELFMSKKQLNAHSLAHHHHSLRDSFSVDGNDYEGTEMQNYHLLDS
jgi:hypothetical protein